MEIEFALRDEKLNIYAMTHGGLPSMYSHQIILCKKAPLSENRVGPFLLDMKKSDAIYKVSKSGMDYFTSAARNEYELAYVAYVDCQLKIKVSDTLFKLLSTLDYFSNWEPEAPLEYFAGHDEGVLVIFRVYRIEDIIPDSLLERGRSGRNFYYNLSKPVTANVVGTVIDDDLFNAMKYELINCIKRRGLLIDVAESLYDVPEFPTNVRNLYNASCDKPFDNNIYKYNVIYALTSGTSVFSKEDNTIEIVEHTLGDRVNYHLSMLQKSLGEFENMYRTKYEKALDISNFEESENIMKESFEKIWQIKKWRMELNSLHREIISAGMMQEQEYMIKD